MRAQEIKTFDQWAIVELFGHVKLAGRIVEEEVFGHTLGRIDIPIAGEGDEAFVTQYFGGGSIYRLTPCSEEAARQVARGGVPKIHRLELSELAPSIQEHRFRPDEDGDCAECGHDIGSAVHFDFEPDEPF